MSIPLLPEFDADGYQVEPSTDKINEIIAAVNASGGGGGGIQLDLVESMDPDATDSMVTIQGFYAYLQRVRVAAELTVTKLSIATAGTGASFDLGIYGSDGVKLAGIASPVASVNTASSGNLTTGTLTEPFTFEPDTDYDLAFFAGLTVVGVRGKTTLSPILNVGTVLRSRRLYFETDESLVATLPGTPAAIGDHFWVAAHN